MTTLADFQSAVSLADTSRAHGFWGQAVMQYKVAGQLGADQLGPAIDARTGGATAGLTQRAWDMNGLLHGLNDDASTATADDANQAKSFITQMMSWYTAANAYSVAPAAHADVKLPALVPTSTILPVYGPMPPIGQALPAPKPVAAPSPAPKPAAVAPKPVQYMPPPIVVSTKKAPISGKNILAAAAGGVGGGIFFGPIGAILGAVGLGLGSKVIFKV